MTKLCFISFILKKGEPILTTIRNNRLMNRSALNEGRSISDADENGGMMKVEDL